MKLVASVHAGLGLAMFACAGCSTAMLAAENPTLAAASAMSEAAANVSNSRTERNVATMEASYAAAKAAAVRTGDEQLSCEQLQAEAYALAEDPETAKTSATLEASGNARTTTGLAASAANAGALVAGSVATQGNPAARDSFLLAQSASVLAQTTAAGDGSRDVALAAGMMPKAARVERVYALAEEKKCPFAQQRAAN
jgi:hypothetical protein